MVCCEKEIIYKRFANYFILNTKPSGKQIKQVWEEEKTIKSRRLAYSYVNNIITNKHSIPSPVRIQMKKQYLDSSMD